MRFVEFDLVMIIEGGGMAFVVSRDVSMLLSVQTSKVEMVQSLADRPIRYGSLAWKVPARTYLAVALV
jgi:hypothetical protein